MVDEGYAATQILTQLHECVIEQDLSDKQKSTITEKMAVSHIIRCCFFAATIVGINVEVKSFFNDSVCLFFSGSGCV